MYDKVIVDADLCIKLGGSEKYRFLLDYLPLLSKESRGISTSHRWFQDKNVAC